jgi:AmmeMemoRadiSam system protein B
MDNPDSSAVISPHAGFSYSGSISLEAVSHVKKNRIWFFGTSHYERITNGLSIFRGNYNSSIGRTIFPENLSTSQSKIISKYLSDEGHRTEEHSIENVLYCLNHFNSEVHAFCGLVTIKNESTFEKISDDLARLWNKDDSIIVSTDWNHFVLTSEIEELMYGVSLRLKEGNIKELHHECCSGVYEACGIDSLYLAYLLLKKVNENTKFNILQLTDSSRSDAGRKRNFTTETCVGYVAANN